MLQLNILLLFWLDICIYHLHVFSVLSRPFQIFCATKLAKICHLLPSVFSYITYMEQQTVYHCKQISSRYNCKSLDFL